MALQMMEASANVLMEFVLDKLKLLSYEQNFCNSRKPPWPRLHKFYFVMPSNNRNEQYLYFESLVSWLLSLVGCNLQLSKEEGDPNRTCMNIMFHLKELGFAPPNWPTTDLKQGFGDAVCCVLDSLANLALESQKFEFKQPVHISESFSGEYEDGLGSILCHIPNKSDIICSGTTWKYSHSDAFDRSTKAEPKIVQQMLKVDIEHVSSELASMTRDGENWRLHLHEAQQLHVEMCKILVDICNQLQRVEFDISSTLEKLQKREKFMNMHLESLVAGYTETKSHLMEVQQIELQEMEAWIGVLEHTLLQNQCKYNIKLSTATLDPHK
eukprot:c23597_g1_i3 orf=138-1115(+)